MSTETEMSGAGVKRLVIAAAGTGGHVMPGLAVAEVMRGRGAEIEWIGTTSGMEGELVERRGIPFSGIAFRGVRGRGLAGAVKGVFALLRASFAARALLRRAKPDAVISTGGYIAVPVGWAAKTLGIPLVLMNCDADLLMSTKLLLPAARRLACGFDGPAASHAGAKAVVTGNPVRSAIVAIPAPDERLSGRAGRLKLFVFGGSLGAQVLNDVVPEALALLSPEERPEVLHQTGRGRDEAVRARYEALGLEARVVPFIHDMAAEYEACDLIVCRAGATSISEIAAAGAAAVLVPFIARTTAHQEGNARFMAGEGAAVHMPQKAFTAEALAAELRRLTHADILALARNARKMAKPDAASAVARLIDEAAGRIDPPHS